MSAPDREVRPAAVPRPGRRMLGVIAAALAVVIVAPIALSSSDLVRWAQDPQGLGLPLSWAWLVFVALDAAAAVCVLMVVYSAARGESGGMFHVLTWIFAAGSATANYRHGQTTPARDDAVFFASMSIMGPLLLEVVLHRVRRWVRADDGRQLVSSPKFGKRWAPGVAFAETFRAWRLALREGIERPADALAHLREIEALRTMGAEQQLRYAFYALGSFEIFPALRWLQARGVVVDQATVDAVTAGLPQAPRPVAPVTPPGGLPMVTVSAVEPAGPDLTAMTKRDAVRFAFSVLGSYDVPGALAWLLARGVQVAESEAYAVRRQAMRETSEGERATEDLPALLSVGGAS